MIARDIKCSCTLKLENSYNSGINCQGFQGVDIGKCFITSGTMSLSSDELSLLQCA